MSDVMVCGPGSGGRGRPLPRTGCVIPTRKNRAEQHDIDRDLYRERNVVERFWSRAKPFRRVATRYEKTARNFLAFLQVASIVILLR